MVYDRFNQITVFAGSILCISAKPTINDQWYELGQFGRLTSTSLQPILYHPVHSVDPTSGPWSSIP